MQGLQDGTATLRRGGGFKSLVWLCAALASLAAAAVAAVLALVFAATVLVITLMGGALLTLTGLASRARRTVRASDSGVIEAHNVGGHSWVAYGWDRRGR